MDSRQRTGWRSNAPTVAGRLSDNYSVKRLLFTLLALSLAGRPVLAAPGDNTSLLLGNPTNAATDPTNYLVVRPQHAMSYNKDKGTANWVAWHTDRGDLGKVKRGSFAPDPLLPAAWQIRPNDYTGSGYDRGHVCPSGDRTATKLDNAATFVMSNMLPQTAALNQYVWKSLEDECRDLVRAGNELYTVAGGLGTKGTIAKGKVNIPAWCWKIVVVLPRGDNDLARINAATRVIAVGMPNEETPAVQAGKWPQYTVSVAAIEKATGYDFFTALPADVRAALVP